LKKQRQEKKNQKFEKKKKHSGVKIIGQKTPLKEQKFEKKKMH